MGRPKKYKTEEERKAAKRSDNRRYGRTEKNNAAQKRYWRSEKGIAQRAAEKQVRQSDEGKAIKQIVDKQYRQSKSGRLHKQRYLQSEEYQISCLKTQLKRYNLTLDDYNQMFEQQNGICAICHRPETRQHKGKITRLCVDHDHTTGEIRGLLCYRCNVTLGMMDDSADRLRMAARYLENRDD